MDPRTQALLDLPLSARVEMLKMAALARGNNLREIRAMAVFYQNSHEYGQAMIFSLLAALLIDDPNDVFYKDCVAYVNDLDFNNGLLSKNLKQLQLFICYCLLDMDGKTYISELKKQFPHLQQNPLNYIFLAYRIEKSLPEGEKNFPLSDKQLAVIFEKLSESVHTFFRDGMKTFTNIDIHLAETAYNQLHDNLFKNERVKLKPLPSVALHERNKVLNQLKTLENKEEKPQQKKYSLDTHSDRATIYATKDAILNMGEFNALKALAIYYQIAEDHNKALIFSYLTAELSGADDVDYKRFIDYIENCPIDKKPDSKLLRDFILAVLNNNYFKDKIFENKILIRLGNYVKNVLQILPIIIQYEIFLDQRYRNARLPFHWNALLQIQLTVKESIRSFHDKSSKYDEAPYYTEVVFNNASLSAETIIKKDELSLPNKNALLNKDSSIDEIKEIARSALTLNVKAIVEMAHYYQDKNDLGRSLIFSFLACSLLDKNDPQYKRHYHYIVSFESHSLLTDKRNSLIFLKQFFLDALKFSEKNFADCLNEANNNLFITLLNKLKEPGIVINGSSDTYQLEMAKFKIIESYNSFLTEECRYTAVQLITEQEVPIPTASPALNFRAR